MDMIVFLDFVYFEENRMAKSLRIFSSFMTVGPGHFDEYSFRLFTIEIYLAIAKNLKQIGMMKMQCVTMYLHI